MEHPTETQRARVNDARPEVTERFELYHRTRVRNGFQRVERRRRTKPTASTPGG
jgi:elongation factor P--beta-lysine ligase